jgi:diguanylate cyclase (GGDEF)-like protein
VTWAELNAHRFGDFSELSRLAQKYDLDLILFAVAGRLEQETVMIARVKGRPKIATVPTVVYHPEAAREVYAEALDAGADDVLSGPWNPEIFGLKIQMFTRRSNRDLGVNPTSRLPGPVLIEREIEGRISRGEEFAVCYLDIDNFKSYNDYYGYLYGDKVIRLTAHIVRDVVFDLVPDGFVGHVGGDDFVFIIPYEMVEVVNANIIKTFDSIIPYRYKSVDRERGKIVAKNRKGEYEVFPLLTVSIAIVVNHDQMFTHVGELSHMLADLKKYTKKLAGSNYMIERRRKY